MCCHTEIEAADHTFYLTQSQILTPGQPAPALTQQHRVPGRVAIGVPIFKSLVWLDGEKSPDQWCMVDVCSLTNTLYGMKMKLRVSDQNGVSLLYIMLEIHHSGWEPSNVSSVTVLSFQYNPQSLWSVSHHCCVNSTPIEHTNVCGFQQQFFIEINTE